MFRILICVMFVLSAQASIVMLDVSTNGVEITSTYNPHPSGAGAVVSSGVSLEVTSDAIISESIAFVASSPSYPDRPAPETIEVQGADVAGVNGVYTNQHYGGDYPSYLKDNSYSVFHSEEVKQFNCLLSYHRKQKIFYIYNWKYP